MAPRRVWGNKLEEGLLIFIGEVLHLPGAVAGNVNGVARGQQLVVALTQEFVAEFQCAIFRFEDASADGQEFVVPGKVSSSISMSL